MHVALVVEDDRAVQKVLRMMLEANGFRVVIADSCARGERDARSQRPDIAIVDLGLPDSDGIELIKAVRTWSPMPIIVLSARSDEVDKVTALEEGADDYVTKPFAPREFMARMQVALRRAARAGVPDATLNIGRWRIDLKSRLARDAEGQMLHLTPIEYRVLEVLAQHIGFVVTHRTLLQQVWGPGRAEQTQYLRVYMKQLRGKLEPDPARPRWLLTETGVGYRLAQPDSGPDA